MTGPIVIAAIQAPTLLNQLAATSLWEFRVALWGDPAYKELDLLKAPIWNGNDAGCAAVLVCSLAHVRLATRLVPKAPQVWVHHTGARAYAYGSIVPEDLGVKMGIAFSHAIALQWATPRHRVAVIRPSYRVAAPGAWCWEPGIAWTMRSRLKERHPEGVARLLRLMGRAPAGAHTLYGEGNPGGFLHPSARARLLGASSAYVSALPRWVGFGLAEHEAFAAGCPVVGGRWGDVASEMPDEYSALTDDDEKMAAALDRVLRDRAYAEQLSRIGQEFIAAHRSPARMDQDIEAFLDRLRTGG